MFHSADISYLVTKEGTAKSDVYFYTYTSIHPSIQITAFHRNVIVKRDS
jgi:hypothetical protein